MPLCRHCKAETSASHYDRVVNNLTPLYGPWDGWRMAGRFLIAPGKGCRITPERLTGMLWEEKARRSSVARLEHSRSRVATPVLFLERYCSKPLGDDAA